MCASVRAYSARPRSARVIYEKKRDYCGDYEPDDKSDTAAPCQFPLLFFRELAYLSPRFRSLFDSGTYRGTESNSHADPYGAILQCRSESDARACADRDAYPDVLSRVFLLHVCSVARKRAVLRAGVDTGIVHVHGRRYQCSMRARVYIAGILLGLIVPVLGIFIGLQVSTTLGTILAFPAIALAFITGVPLGMWHPALFGVAALLSVALWIAICAVADSFFRKR